MMAPRCPGEPTACTDSVQITPGTGTIGKVNLRGRCLMKFSARNSFKGTITAVNQGPVGTPARPRAPHHQRVDAGLAAPRCVSPNALAYFNPNPAARSNPMCASQMIATGTMVAAPRVRPASPSSNGPIDE